MLGSSPAGFTASRHSGSRLVNPFCFVAMFGQKQSIDSTQIAEAQGSQSQLRVDVTGKYLVDPNSFMP